MVTKIGFLLLSTEENIGNSRDCSFEQMIKLRTKGEGVDFVLNSLAEEQLHASIRCLGRSGTFLEIGKFDLANDSKIGTIILFYFITVILCELNSHFFFSPKSA